MLSVRDLSAAYGSVSVLKAISFEIQAGEVVALIGPNGAGKSTTLMVICGMVPNRSGSITFCSEEIVGLPPHRIVERGICQVPEGRRIFPKLSVLENLEMGGYLQTDRKKIEADLEEVFCLFPILKERRFQRGGTLSGGEQQMLAIGRALMSHPKLLLLDEPSLGLSPLMAEKIFEMIEAIRRQGKTILLVEQNAHAALNLAGRGYVMETGRIVLEDQASRLLTNPMVRLAYLGGY
ncbi:MAG: ABC transporter ATP-binding protein [Candidatus Manganitrophaceae bacterium]